MRTRVLLIVVLMIGASGCGIDTRPLVHSTSVHLEHSGSAGQPAIVQICTPQQADLGCVKGPITTVETKAWQKWDLSSMHAGLKVQMAHIRRRLQRR
jgi:hypothetical protein